MIYHLLKKFLLFFLLFKVSYGITLKQAINEALNNNLEIKQLKQDLKIGEININLAKNSFYPEFFFNSGYTVLKDRFYSEIPSFSPLFPNLRFKQSEKNYFNYEIGINIPIFTGFKRINSLKLSKIDYKAREKFLREKEREIRLKVIDIYINLLILNEILNVLQKQKESIEEHLKKAENFYKEGLITDIQVLQTKVKLAEVKREIKKVEGQIKVGKANLNLLLNRDINIDFKVEKIDINIPKNLSLKELIKKALRNRDIIKALNYKEKEFKYIESINKSEFLPSVIAGSKYFYTNQYPYTSPKGNTSFYLIFSLKFQGFKPYYNYLKSKEEEKKFRFYKRDTINKIVLQIKKSYEDFIVARENLKVAENGLSEAEKYFKKVKEQYNEQLADTTDFLNAEAYLTKAKADRVIAYYQLILSYLKLKELIGEDYEK